MTKSDVCEHLSHKFNGHNVVAIDIDPNKPYFPKEPTQIYFYRHPSSTEFVIPPVILLVQKLVC